jgi:ribosomal protein S18 acetylase RimI-like enzyme
LVAENEKNIIGFLYAHIIDNDWCMIDNVAVLKSHRNKGIGTLLIDHFFNEAKEQKITYASLLTEENNAPLKSFWNSKGFEEDKSFIWYGRKIQ